MTHAPINTDPANTDPANADLPAALRLQLRGLRRDAEPGHDLWPGIAARIATQPQMPAAQARPARRGLHHWPALAAAAVLALAIGLGWQLSLDRGAASAPATIAAASATAAPSPLLRKADAMSREYQGALREVTASQPLAGEHPELQQLDASADEVRAALAQAPDAGYLLHRLQRIHAQRLTLTRRLVQA